MKYSKNRKYRDNEIVEEEKVVTKKRVKKAESILDKVKNLFKGKK